MMKKKRTKIIATLGPSSSHKNVIRGLAIAGVDVFRLNFSHGTHDEHKNRYNIIRDLEKELGRSFGILADLQGPKLRVGILPDQGLVLQKDQKIFLSLSNKSSENHMIPISHPEIFTSIKKGDHLLLDDGKINLKVMSVSGNKCEADVIVGGVLTSNKGLNLPNSVLPISSITDKDRVDLDFALSLGVDWVAFSFVQSSQDIEEAKSLIQGKAKIMAKIEKPKALDDIVAIIENSDGIMVARGDLGVELLIERVPSVQKHLIRLCRKFHKPIVIATQMLESMTHTPTPTRAEVTDVANAVYEGVDAVMLSAESASGDFPIESVDIMNKVIETVENDHAYREIASKTPAYISASARDVLVNSAREIADDMGARAIVIYSFSGQTALAASGSRPRVPLLILTPEAQNTRWLNLIWGTHTLGTEKITSIHEMVSTACSVSLEHQYVTKGDNIVVVGGVPFGASREPNIIRMVQVGHTETYG